MVRAVYVEASDIYGGRNDGEGLVLFTAGTIVRGGKPCGAGTGLLIAWFGQTEVRTAPIVGTACIGDPR